MPQPPKFSEIESRLLKDGFVMVRQKGSHRIYKEGSRRVVLAGKPSDHPTQRTWRSIQREARWK
jgi:predicted RNA binding protein YcfA (HicA-like mRNA interferase family)